MVHCITLHYNFDSLRSWLHSIKLHCTKHRLRVFVVVLEMEFSFSVYGIWYKDIFRIYFISSPPVNCNGFYLTLRELIIGFSVDIHGYISLVSDWPYSYVFQILGTGMDTQDTSPSVLLFFDKQRFIFNAGEVIS